VPAVQRLGRDGTLQQADVRLVLHAVHQRAGQFTYGAIAVFIISGLAMLSRNVNYAGILSIGNLWTQVILIKHAVVAILVVSTVYMMTAANRMPQPGDDAGFALWAERHTDLAELNLLLGVVVLALTAVATSIPAGG
jgi:uncharacterized membrane protein